MAQLEGALAGPDSGGDDAKLERLGHQFAELRQQELDRLAGTGNAGAAGEQRSVAELQEEARRLDIEGRSKMNKEELARAVAERS